MGWFGVGWRGVGWGGDDDVPCTWTHLWCYGEWGGVGMMTFLAHEHIFDATEMMSFLAHESIFDATEMMTFLAHEHIFDGIMSVLNALQMYRNDSEMTVAAARFVWHQKTHLILTAWAGWTKMGKKFLDVLQNSTNSFRLTGVALRPPANGYNHSYIYI